MLQASTIHTPAKKPIIGITSTLLKYNRHSEGVYVHQDYHNAIEDAGGLPVILPLTRIETLIQLISLCDGVLFSGGEDIDPVFYGRDPHQQLGETFARRDAVELEAFRHVMDTGKPLLAICRGIQLLNVAYGGTLYQDLSSQIPDALQHTQKINRDLHSHRVEIEVDTLLYGIYGQQHIRVNSLHHQAIEQMAAGFKIAARAPDGVIEAVEDPSRKFMIAVQWHPESIYKHDVPSQKLFQAFIHASS